MVNAFPSGAQRPTPGSLVERWLSRHKPHPDSFVAGVRVLAGDVAAERARWRFRRSGVDPVITDGIVSFTHGAGNTMQLRVERGSVTSGPGLRTGYVAFTARVEGGGQVAVSVPAGELGRFGMDE